MVESLLLQSYTIERVMTTRENDRKATTEEIFDFLREEREGLKSISTVEHKLTGQNRMSLSQLDARGTYFRKKVESWSEIRHAYIHGIYHPELGHIYPKIPEIAYQLGISERTLYDKATKGKWNLLKALFRQKMQEKQEEFELRQILSESARYEQQQLRNFEKIQNIVEKKLDNFQKKEMQINAATGGREEVIVDEMSARDLKTLTDTLSVCKTEIRNLIGKDDIVEKVAEEMEAIKRLDVNAEGADEKLKELQSQLGELSEARQTYKKKKQTMLPEAKNEEEAREK